MLTVSVSRRSQHLTVLISNETQSYNQSSRPCIVPALSALVRHNPALRNRIIDFIRDTIWIIQELIAENEVVVWRETIDNALRLLKRSGSRQRRPFSTALMSSSMTLNMDVF